MDFSTIDFQSATFTVFFAIGVVNVVTLWKKELTSQQKWFISVAAALVASFVPVQLGNEILNRVRDAVAVAFIASGGYKTASKAGGE